VSAEAVDEPASRPATLVVLAVLGAVLLGWTLFLNRIALGGPLGAAPEWVVNLARPYDMAHEAVFGDLAEDSWLVTGQRVRLRHFLRSQAVAGVAYLLAVALVLRLGSRLGTRAYEVILVVAICARILPLAAPPLLETDPYRYLWDGAAVRAGVNPYRYPPAQVRQAAAKAAMGERPAAPDLARLVELTADPEVNRALALVNHPGVPTVYPPLAQALFGAAAWVAPGNIYVLKLMVALVDLVVLALLAALLHALGRPRGWLLLYGWCPLAIKEYAASAHYDPLATAGTLAALLVLARGTTGARRVMAGALLGVGALGKLFPLVAAFALAGVLGVPGLVAAAGVTALGLLPLAMAGPQGGEGLVVFGSRWLRNAGPFELVRGPLRFLDADPYVVHLGSFPEIPLDSQMVAKLILGAGLLAFLASLARQREATPEAVVRRVTLALGAAVLVSPVVNPWYLGWVLPLAALHGSLGFAVLASASGAYYFYFVGGAYALPAAGGLDVRWLEYLPALGLIAAELRAQDRGAGGELGDGPVLLPGDGHP
jgi:hypothetical protein